MTSSYTLSAPANCADRAINAKIAVAYQQAAQRLHEIASKHARKGNRRQAVERQAEAAQHAAWARSLAGIE